MTIHEDDIIERFLPKNGDIVVDIGDILAYIQ